MTALFTALCTSCVSRVQLFVLVRRAVNITIDKIDPFDNSHCRFSIAVAEGLLLFWHQDSCNHPASYAYWSAPTKNFPNVASYCADTKKDCFITLVIHGRWAVKSRWAIVTCQAILTNPWSCDHTPANPLTHWGQNKMTAIFTTDIFKCIATNAKMWISVKVSLNFAPQDPIDNNSVLAHVGSWCQTGHKPMP